MSVEEELAESSVVIANYREQIEELQKLVKDYDAYIARIAPFSHKDGKTPQELRRRAKEEGVDL